MPIEYEMMVLKRLTEAAISRKNAWTGAEEWSDIGSESVMHQVQEETSEALVGEFSEDELNAMRELLRRGYWLKWNDEIKRPILFRISAI